jgi:positive regulator of sigma E activity
MRSVLKFSALLFIANSIGYFIGAMLNARVGGSTGMLLWGVVYGLCLGAGIGAVLHFAQRWRTESS